MNVFELGELPAGAGHVEALKLFERLIAEVGPVDQEQDAFGAALGDEPFGDVDGGERLARTGRHLDEGPWPVLPKRPLQVDDGVMLSIPEPRGLLF